MEFLVLNSLEKSREDWSGSGNGSNDSLDQMFDSSIIGNTVDQQATNLALLRSPLKQNNKPPDENLSPSTSKSLKVGVKMARDLLGCISKKDIFGAVKILTGTMANPRVKRAEGGAKHERAHTAATCEDLFDDIEPIVETTLDLEIQLASDQKEVMGRCWNEEPEELTFPEKDFSIDGQIAAFLAELDGFRAKVGAPIRLQAETTTALVNRKHSRLAKTLFDYVSFDLGSYSPLFGNVTIESKQRKVVESLGTLKQHILELVDELGKHTLEQPVQLPPKKICQIPLAPPPPPPPPIYLPTSGNFRPTAPHKTPMTGQPKSDLHETIRTQLKRANTTNLKHTQLKRSPGGTPLRKRSPVHGTMERDLIDGLRRRFRSMNMDFAPDDSKPQTP